MQRQLIALAVAATLGAAANASPAGSSSPSPTARATSDSDPAIGALLERARLWRGRNRDDLARQALDKLFLIDPDHAEGLSMLGALQVRGEQAAAAQRTLQRLRQAHPGYPGTEHLAALLRLKSQDKDKLRQARLLAKSGRTEAAIAALRALYPDGPPDGDLALEYWQLVADTGNGWEAARAGLAKLVHDNPDNQRYRLAQAEHLIGRPPIDLGALRLLVSYAQLPQYARAAKAAWRKVLLRLDPVSTSIPLIQEYLKQDAGDTAVRERLLAVSQAVDAQRKLLADPDYRAKLEGLALLDSGKIELAEERLQQALTTRSNDADALGGMGLLRLRQGHHAEAEAYFLRAQQLDPAQQSKWSGLIRTARYWGLLREADDARRNAEFALAAEKIQAARQLDPREAHALLAAGELYEAQKLLLEAEQAFRDALALAPTDAEAIGGLMTFYLRSGREEAAQTVLHRVTPAQQKELGRKLNTLRAGLLRDRADRLLAKKRTAEAIAELERAASIDADDPWLRFDLARLYAARGQAERGQALFDALLERHPKDAAASYAAALFQAGQDRELDALLGLERVASSERTANMSALQRRLWVSVNSKQALLLEQNGQAAAARRLLQDMEQACSQDAALQLELIDTWFELGEYTQAHRLLAANAALFASAADNLRLRQARLLTRLAAPAINDGKQVLPSELAPVLEDLASRQLSQEDADALSDLRLSLALDQAEALRRQRQPAAALAILQTSRQQHAGSPRLHYALARLQRELKQWDEALEQYRVLMLLSPDDSDAVLALIDTLMAAGRRDEARQWIDSQLSAVEAAEPDTAATLAGTLLELGEAEDLALARRQLENVLAVDPDHARALDYAGQLAQRDGRNRQALVYWQHSLASAMKKRQPVIAGHTTKLPSLSQLRLVDSRLHSVSAPPEQVLAQQANNGIYRRLAEVLDQENRWLAGAIDVRSRSGTTGKSQYSASEIPLEWRQPWQWQQWSGRLRLHADSVRLNAGRLDLSDAAATATFGSLLLCQPNCSSTPAVQTASGLALNAAFDSGELRLDAGTTPLGFAVQNLVGGILKKGDLGPFSYSLDASRRPVTGSVLSYAGSRDPQSGKIWGGVVASGIRLGLSRDDGGAFGAWSSLGVHQLTGKNVQSNKRMQLMAGTYWRAINENDRLLSLGITGMHWRFSENAGEYTFGHGGYYSPESYSSLSLPLTFGQRSARFSYALRGAISTSVSQTKSADYFPTDAAMQAQAQTLSATTGIDPHYTGGPGRGVGRSLAASWEYQMDPWLFVGGRFELERATDYTPNRFLLYLRYAVDQSAVQPVLLPPEAMQSSLQY